MTEKLSDLIKAVAEEWSAIVPPNEAGLILADQMTGTIAGFAAERGKMAFEDEPAGFEAALQATKEGAQ